MINTLSSSSCSFNHLPNEIAFAVFSTLDTSTLAKICCVSTAWFALASDPTLWNNRDLRDIAPLLTVFDRSNWRNVVDLFHFGLTVADAPPDNQLTLAQLQHVFPTSRVKCNAGITSFIMPKGLTLKKLKQLIESSTIMFYYPLDKLIVQDAILNKFGDIQVERTYRVIITNDVIDGTANMSFQEQENVIQRIGIDGLEIPNFLELATLLFARSILAQQKRGYRDQTLKARCADKQGDKHIMCRLWYPNPSEASIQICEDDQEDGENLGIGCILRYIAE